MEELIPSEVRKRILEDHRVLRGMLDRLEVLACSVLQGRTRIGAELHKQSEALDQCLREHMKLEEEILAPKLREADGWGPARVERFDDEHARQREIMDGMQSLEGDTPLYQFALQAWGFARLIREDMAEEERLSLTEKVLSDDPINTEMVPD